ncbi:imelysin family protein [Donghicola mangrovi]|uniref:Imelysin family protein n=1 Tax=Donghicola mangrovi TaxID=2729614 RepID=A0A850QDJ7_9RHOB|nr:imelysin family protein [Donghicola mangrovi]NVO24229.1 imelysin family protein [Donghicola mangrovi]
MTPKLTSTALVLSLMAGGVQAQSIANPDAPGVPLETHSEETGLPYFAPGRGEIDHDAIRRRVLTVFERQFGAFANETQKLTDAAEAYCAGTTDIEAFKDQFRATWLAWAPLDSYQFGPIEAQGAALTVNFWPDKKNFVGRALRDLLNKTPEEQAQASVVGGLSVGAQGLPAIEMLLFSDAQECPAIIGISGNLHQIALSLYDGWFGEYGWAELARTAGPDNPVYLQDAEFTKVVYTALDFGLTRIADTRLGRPLGTFERSNPTQAEAWRSGLTNDIIHAQLDGIEEVVRDGFAGDVTETNRSWIYKVFDQTEGRVDAIGSPISEAVQDPMGRMRVEGLQSKVLYLINEMDQEIGPNLGVETGFSAADGD